MSNFDNLKRYVLLEKHVLTVRVVGIFTYVDAIKLRNQLQKSSEFKDMVVYEIQGPYTVNSDDSDLGCFGIMAKNAWNLLEQTIPQKCLDFLPIEFNEKKTKPRKKFE